MTHPEMSDSYLDAIRRGLAFARELGQRPGSVHLLVGVSLGDGPAAQALATGQGPSLREVVVAGAGELGSGAAAWQHVQAQEAAREFATALGQRRAPEHLLVALVDQGMPEVLAALDRAGIDQRAARQACLAAVGVDFDRPPLTMPSPMPAGTMDRAPLPVDRLDARAWRVLRWRQDHLPLSRLRGRPQAGSLYHLEERATLRLADRLELDDDQRYSLLRHHAEQVKERVAAAKPELAGPVRNRAPRRRAPGGRVARVARGLLAGWSAWLDNRRTGLRDRWFRLRTRAAYRGCPQS